MKKAAKMSGSLFDIILHGGRLRDVGLKRFL